MGWTETADSYTGNEANVTTELCMSVHEDHESEQELFDSREAALDFLKHFMAL